MNGRTMNWLGVAALVVALGFTGPALAGDRGSSDRGSFDLKSFFSKSSATVNGLGSAVGQTGGVVRVDVLLDHGLRCYAVDHVDRHYEPWGATRVDLLRGADVTVALDPAECHGIQENRVIFTLPHPAYTDILNLTFTINGRVADHQRVQIEARGGPYND